MAPRLLALAVLALALQSASCFVVQSPVVIIDEDSACVKAFAPTSSANPCDTSTPLLHAYPGFASALGGATLTIIATVLHHPGSLSDYSQRDNPGWRFECVTLRAEKSPDSSNVGAQIDRKELDGATPTRVGGCTGSLTNSGRFLPGPAYV